MEIEDGGLKVRVFEQYQIPNGSVAHTSYNSYVTFVCTCEGTFWKLSGTLHITGLIMLPRIVTRVPLVDKSVVDTNTAAIHEFSWHILKAEAKAKSAAIPFEEPSVPYRTKGECETAGRQMQPAVREAFMSEMRRTQNVEKAGGTP